MLPLAQAPTSICRRVRRRQSAVDRVSALVHRDAPRRQSLKHRQSRAEEPITGVQDGEQRGCIKRYHSCRKFARYQSSASAPLSSGSFAMPMERGIGRSACSCTNVCNASHITSACGRPIRRAISRRAMCSWVGRYSVVLSMPSLYHTPYVATIINVASILPVRRGRCAGLHQWSAPAR
jgi:hypothetical protein